MTKSKTLWLTMAGVLVLALFLFLWTQIENSNREAVSRGEAQPSPVSSERTVDLPAPLPEAESIGARSPSLAESNARLFGSVSPSPGVRIRVVGEDREVRADLAANDSYSIEVEPGERVWIQATKEGFLRQEKSFVLRDGSDQRFDIDLGVSALTDVYLAEIEHSRADVLGNMRVLALNRPIPEGIAISGLQGSIGNPFGVGRFLLAEEFRATSMGLFIGQLRLDRHGVFFATLCLASEVVSVQRVSVPEDDRVIFHAGDPADQVRGDLVITFEESVKSGWAVLADSNGGMDQKAITGKQVTFEELARGAYLLQVRQGRAFSVHDVHMAGGTVEIGPLSNDDNAIQLHSRRAGSTEKILLQGQQGRLNDPHYIELVPHTLGGEVSSLIFSSNFRYPFLEESGDMTMFLAPGIYKVRLNGERYMSDFVTIDSRGGSVEAWMDCYEKRPLTITPGGSWDWTGKMLVTKDMDGTVLENRLIWSSLPVPLLPSESGWRSTFQESTVDRKLGPW